METLSEMRFTTQASPLVTSWEVERLKTQLGEAARGRRFLLQGGACAESFDHCQAQVITSYNFV